MRNKPSKGPVLSRILVIAAIIVAGFFAFALTAFHIFPLNVAETKIKDALSAQGAIISFGSLARTFPFGLAAGDIVLTDAASGAPLLKLDTAKARLEVLSVLRLDPTVDIRATVGGGTITGKLRPGLNGARLDLAAGDLEFRDIAALTSAGVNIDGSFGGTVSVNLIAGACPSGSARLRGVNIKEEGLKLAGFKLPTGDIDTAGLNAAFEECKAVLEGLWLDGRDMSARLSGEVFLKAPLQTSPVRMTLEVTPRGEAAGKSWMLTLLSSFRKSANFYSANIGGTIAHPVAER